MFDSYAWPVYLELFGIPVALIVWVFYRAFIKKRPRREINNDVMLTIFVSVVWLGVYFSLLN